MDILSRSLFFAIIWSLSIATNGTETPDITEEKILSNKPSLQPDKTKKIETSLHLKNIAEFHNDIVVILKKVESILKYEPLTILQDAVLDHSSSLETIISKLEEYLQAMKNGVYLTDADHSAFTTSIIEEINVLRDESEKLTAKVEKSTIMEKSISDRKEVIDLLTKIQKKTKSFETSIGTLEGQGIILRGPISIDDQPPQEKFDISILIRLKKLYEKIESIENNDSSTELNSETKLETLKLLVTRLARDNSEILRQFVPVIQAMKKRIVTLIPETEESHNKIAEEVMLKALSALELEKQMESLLKDVKLLRKDMAENVVIKNSQDHEEL